MKKELSVDKHSFNLPYAAEKGCSIVRFNMFMWC